MSVEIFSTAGQLLLVWYYTVSQKNVPHVVATIFTYMVRLRQFLGTNVAEKVGNQNVLYFSTSPN